MDTSSRTWIKPRRSEKSSEGDVASAKLGWLDYVVPRGTRLVLTMPSVHDLVGHGPSHRPEVSASVAVGLVATAHNVSIYDVPMQEKMASFVKTTMCQSVVKAVTDRTGCRMDPKEDVFILLLRGYIRAKIWDKERLRDLMTRTAARYAASVRWFEALSQMAAMNSQVDDYYNKLVGVYPELIIKPSRIRQSCEQWIPGLKTQESKFMQAVTESDLVELHERIATLTLRSTEIEAVADLLSLLSVLVDI